MPVFGRRGCSGRLHERCFASGRGSGSEHEAGDASMTAKDPVSLGIATREPAARALQQSEEALRLSEERLRLAQQAAHVGSFEWNIQTGRVTWSQGLEPLTSASLRVLGSSCRASSAVARMS